MAARISQDIELRTVGSKEEQLTSKTEYNYDVGEYERTGSSFGAFFNIVCVVAGTGVLQMAYAFTLAGWISVLITVVSAILATYTGSILIKCLYYKGPKHRLDGYAAIGEAAFGRFGKIFTQIFQYSILLGVSCLYLILTKISIQDLTNQLGLHVDSKIWVTTAACLIWIPFATLRTLKEVSWLALFGVIATIYVVIVIGIAGFTHLEENQHQRHETIIYSGLPMGIASISFCFGGTPVYPHIEQTMKRPKDWPKVLLYGSITCCVIYLCAGIFGYYVYGQSSQSPIFLSLPEGALNTTSTIAITLHVLLAAPIMLTSFSMELEGYFKISTSYRSRTRSFTYRLALRTAILIILTIIAMFVKDFGAFMSLVGAISNTMVIFILPVVCYLKLFNFRRSIFDYVMCFICIVVGVISCILGTKDAIVALKSLNN
ncbi:hypothetical protein K493DRAFT_204436 [Basidiobolus meristosporus CBS 931.73]|uniref:Amino acid transporter transmembrane domain-containing protein n=1 Tax=Basidiobolus meristosporus CBS 931.73 TaxID=1314790 RepID=A0A1Y1Z589_9FUNG|nr:hypothetical protein K493DRAFT_204436 [Basidiobolus meristosporus CBS 931.73]|eukprot:ORY05423.1 hypothetical protein K493DRAFT_204436 [Basidiobolus meristosporus CBS 931.73]